jgi:hypothetical protein
VKGLRRAVRQVGQLRQAEPPAPSREIRGAGQGVHQRAGWKSGARLGTFPTGGGSGRCNARCCFRSGRAWRKSWDPRNRCGRRGSSGRLGPARGAGAARIRDAIRNSFCGCAILVCGYGPLRRRPRGAGDRWRPPWGGCGRAAIDRWRCAGPAVIEVFEEDEEIFGIILVDQDVFVGAQAVEKAIAAGCGFTFGGARTGGFLGVLTVGVDLGLGGSARFVRIFHVRISGRGWPVSTFMLCGRSGGFGWHFWQVVESRRESILAGWSPKTGCLERLAIVSAFGCVGCQRPDRFNYAGGALEGGRR